MYSQIDTPWFCRVVWLLASLINRANYQRQNERTKSSCTIIVQGYTFWRKLALILSYDIYNTVDVLYQKLCTFKHQIKN